MGSTDAGFTGRCYCGAVTLRAASPPLITTYCHCSDCRRLTGAPVGAFSAFAEGAITASPGLGDPVEIRPGVTRWFCRSCGSQLAARYAYLPEQIYTPVGLWDQAAEFEPQSHSHMASALPWFHLQDDLPRHEASGRDRLNAASPLPE